MHSVMKIMLVASFAQVYAQTAMDKLSATPLADADLEATTLAMLLNGAVNHPVAMVPPAIAQIRPDLRARPNMAFVLADEEKEAPAPKKADPPAENVRFFKKNPMVPLEKTPNSYQDLVKSDKFAKQLLDGYKSNCYNKGCGGKNGEWAERSLQVINVPAVAVIGLLVGSGITFAMRRSRAVKAVEPLEV
eukprot:gnl/MRDRNA2_/MRDRNA2_83674_c0_seq1.p1 gnl/MRDRNA2_/MRDRNA2_83674_c0~~gnl/MRDRNA2_/MRDRNA2_83674_c0_seq1.p1  ORF type:complete len:190 (-),score=38.21 gnl/MRDRNA2_/MRDRNA2_83674_c0_seq1:120-689(-)